MKTVTLLSALVAGTMLAAPVTASAQDDAQTKGQAELAELLEGRVAGEPQSCVRTLPSTPVNIIDGTALVVDRGSTIYVNIPDHPDSLDDNDALKIRKFGSGTQLCRTDIITTFDRTGGFYTGNVSLGDFVPYERVGG
ncbi:hypothetical protein [Pelagerythrobacter sp.]|uniref:hypothetical protein n=1 Tax=Pelagerythrobacter sp. TaxID=2800702 RepID=UPI0035B3D947